MARTSRGPTRVDHPTGPEFHVALSFAGEDREYVEKTAERLKLMGIRVFYDKYEQVTLWGKNLYDHLSNVYGKMSMYTVIFISKSYSRKLWTNHERQSAQARAFSEKREYILPARFDGTDLPGIPSTVGYIDLSNVSPEELAELIKAKVGPLRRERFMPGEPDRLLSLLKAKAQKRKRQLTSVANGVFSDLSLMTPAERRLVSLIFWNTCPTGPEIDDDVHINIEVLARMSGLTRRDIQAICSRIECLNFVYKLTSHDGSNSRKNILRLTYEPSYADETLSGNWTSVVFAIFRCIEDNLCPTCRQIALDIMDFSVLSTLAGFPDLHATPNTTSSVGGSD
jgi:hypothetical protein